MIDLQDQVLNTVQEKNVEFVRLQFTDIQGIVKNVVIPVAQLGKALISGISFDGFPDRVPPHQCLHTHASAIVLNLHFDGLPQSRIFPKMGDRLSPLGSGVLWLHRFCNDIF